MDDLLFGEVFLKTSDTGRVVKLAIIENGKFQFDPLPTRNYYLQISCLGYEAFTEIITLDKDLKLNVQLIQSDLELAEITIVEKRSQIRMENGNMIMSIANTELASQSDFISALALLPSLQISPDGTSVSVLGKGSPLLYLDNQRISSEQLQSIDLNSILDVELINNPSAKYEAEGRAVLLIRRKKEYTDGFQLNFSERLSFRRNFNNYLGLSGSYKRNRLEFRGNFAYNALRPWEGSKSNQIINNANLQYDYNGISDTRRPQFTGDFGLFYQLNADDYLSINTSFRVHTSEGPIESQVFQNDLLGTTKANTFNMGFDERSFTTVNVNYQKSFTTKSKLFTGLQATRYIRNLDSEINVDFNESGFNLIQTRDQDFSINTYAIRMDFEQLITDKIKWESGYNFALGDSEAFSNLNFLDQQTLTIFNYDYKEFNQAYYSQINGNYKKLNFNIGLRYERNKVEAGFQEVDTLLVDRTLNNLFPRLSLNINLDISLVLSLNYNKSINRPHFLNATSISTFITPYYEYTRNVNLQSTITQEFSANLALKNNSLGIAYVTRNAPVFVASRYQDNLSRILSQPINFDKEQSLNVTLLVPIQSKIWSSTNFARWSIVDLQDNIGEKITVKPFWYFYSRNQFRINKTTNTGFTGFLFTNQAQGIIDRKGLASLSLFFNTKILKNFNLGISWNDIFQSQEYSSQSTFNDVFIDETIFTDRREFSISLRYNIGKRFKSNYKNKDVDLNLERM